MVKATFNGVVIAESKDTVKVEGNHYFPPDSVKKEFLTKTSHTTVCGWKGTASYYTIKVGDQEAKNKAWFYEAPKDAAKNIKDHVAFYTSAVKIE